MSVFHQQYIEPLSCFSFGRSPGETYCSTQKHPFYRPPSPAEHEDLLEAEERRMKQEMDLLLSESLSGLTFEDRQQNLEILHGVEERITEEASFLESTLCELDFCLESMKARSMYERAEQMDPEYVHAIAFRVMFLRANQYDPKASADQMIRFFEHKHELFGQDKLVKDITIEDLDEDDLSCLRKGGVQLVGKDRSGRRALLYVSGLFAESSKTIKSDMRLQFFLVMKALQSDEEAQLRGTISIWYAVGGYKSQTKERRYFDYFLAARALPQKKAAIHVCVETLRQGVLLNTVVKVMKGSVRARFRVHYGSPMECQYQLASYGIPSKLLPVDGNGKVIMDRHMQWIQSCYGTNMETTILPDLPVNTIPEEADGITVTSPKDVLFTGAKVSYTEGNKRFLELVQDYLQDYDSASTLKKQQVVDEIIHKIHESGGRFLCRQTGTRHSLWQEVPPAEIRKKVVQSFRNRRRRVKMFHNNS